LRFMFRYRNRENMRKTIFEGSEFRTTILLVSRRNFWDEGENLIRRQISRKKNQVLT
jgi:hypothetical protein